MRAIAANPACALHASIAGGRKTMGCYRGTRLRLHGGAPALAALWPWLWLGQWLHAGMIAAMVLGGHPCGARLGSIALLVLRINKP